MKKLILILTLLLPVISFSQVVMSWNIQNLGESKFKKDTIVPAIADVMIQSKADIIAIQELVLNNYGDSCIIQLANILKYDYVISDRTSGKGSERYAYLYSKEIKLDSAYLDESLADSIDREPFIAHFTYMCKKIVIRQVHLVPASKNPQYEVSQLYKYKDGIICGDFNLTSNHLIYIPLLTYFQCPLKGLPTTFKTDGSISKNSYDHFFVEKGIKINHSEVFDFNYGGDRRSLSDHLPILIIL
jgi:deoxyribonuclease-1-like protein